MRSNPERLKALLGTPQYRWLIDRIHKRMERGGDLTGSMTIKNPSPEQRTSLDRLMGSSPSRGTTLHIRLGQLEKILRNAELCMTLREGIEHLTGSVTNKKKEAALRELRWKQLIISVSERMSIMRKETKEWLTGIERFGLLRRLSGSDLTSAESLLTNAVKVIQQLPAKGIQLAELAASITGDSHALDEGRPLGTLVIRAAAIMGQVEKWQSAEDRRNAWASAGVLCDELSCPVLTLNLKGETNTPTGRALQIHAENGEPYRISVRQLIRSPAKFSTETTGSKVYICENPTVVAVSATRLSSKSAPLICTEGQPKTALRLLLEQLRSCGIKLLYHGDYDWGGITIANLIIKQYGARPWRFSSGEYLEAPKGKTFLKGSPIAASWDPILETEMKRIGIPVYEEQLLDSLIRDLAA